MVPVRNTVSCDVVFSMQSSNIGGPEMNTSHAGITRHLPYRQSLHESILTYECMMTDLLQCNGFVEVAAVQLRLGNFHGVERALRNAERSYRANLRSWSNAQDEQLRNEFERRSAIIACRLKDISDAFDLTQLADA